MDIKRLLKLVVDKKASDLFITAGYPPSIKMNGRVLPVGKDPLASDRAKAIVLALMDDNQQREFARDHECNFAISEPGVGRFRVSAFYQRNQAGMVLRRIETKIPTISELYLPASLKDLAMTKRGLIIFVGATGTGKSTSLAALIGHINKHSSGHIISIEDPIEFVHEHNKCIVTQREVGIDTESFEVALKNTLRQAPDVVMIGEIRTRETMEHALTFAETGHLCLATLHANNANQALDRIMHFFQADRHQQVWMDLSLNLKGIVAQQLVRATDGESRRPVVEILLNSPLAKDMIRQGKVHELKALMAKSRDLGMQTFDQALFDLYNIGEINFEEAIRHSDAPNDLRLKIKLSSEVDGEFLQGSSDNLTLQHEESY